ncbi:MAG: hypothetical protein K2O16_08090 [Lachnospiraceae bacterium]|nr:hypothetical protein [Lachnospiraceae bacterium]
MKRAVKGNFGYLAAKRRWAAARTVLYFAISLSLFIAGIVTTGSKENLLTIVAVLGCLPACKSLVDVIMLFRATGCSSRVREALIPAQGRLIGMYDMYFTSYQKNFAISHMVVEGKIILGYTESGKCDMKACQEHLQTMLKQGGFKDMTIKISDNLETYTGQLKNLNQMEQDNDPQKDDEVRSILYDISL